MKRFLKLLGLSSLLLTACVGTLAPIETATPMPIVTATPTPVGTWETVIDGRIYDEQTDPGKPIVGASITYDVLHSYFSVLQGGRPNKTITDELGEFVLPVIVHDTDVIRILVEAQGYLSYEERLGGIDLVPGRRIEVGLTKLLTATASPPNGK